MRKRRSFVKLKGFFQEENFFLRILAENRDLYNSVNFCKFNLVEFTWDTVFLQKLVVSCSKITILRFV